MISTHVLDTSRGRPAAGVPVLLEAVDSGGSSREVGRHLTDVDGRVRELAPGDALGAGIYRLTFETGAYYRTLGSDSFYPTVSVVFIILDVGQHYHVPLLVSPYGYSTYRGS